MNRVTDTFRHIPDAGMVEDAAGDTSGTVLRLVLAENRGDCMSLGLFAHYVSSFTGCPDDRELHLEVMAQLGSALNAGLLTVGDMIGSSHRPWPDSPAESLAWVQAAWPDGPLETTFEALQNICWLVNTPAGDQAARASA